MTSATIKLFLPHGDAKRLRVGEVSNWTGNALAAPRTELDDLLLREEAESAGVYFLFGSDPETGDALAYIGEAEVIRLVLLQRNRLGNQARQLTMRTFHIGGAASRTAVASQVESKSNGVIQYSNSIRYVKNTRNELIIISRSGEVIISDDNGREKERHKIPYGATLLVHDGDTVKIVKYLHHGTLIPGLSLLSIAERFVSKMWKKE